MPALAKRNAESQVPPVSSINRFSTGGPINWHLTPHSRFMWNYIVIWRNAPGEGSDDLTQVLVSRFQIDF
jgi:hypothetical protein